MPDTGMGRYKTAYCNYITINSSAQAWQIWNKGVAICFAFLMSLPTVHYAPLSCMLQEKQICDNKYEERLEIKEKKLSFFEHF